jgi:hypothetical protein
MHTRNTYIIQHTTSCLIFIDVKYFGKCSSLFIFIKILRYFADLSNQIVIQTQMHSTNMCVGFFFVCVSHNWIPFQCGTSKCQKGIKIKSCCYYSRMANPALALLVTFVQQMHCRIQNDSVYKTKVRQAGKRSSTLETTLEFV